jgi:ribosomal-protein-serine acetyltransferase
VQLKSISLLPVHKEGMPANDLFYILTPHETIQLEPMVPDHAEQLLQVVNGNRSHLGRWLPWVPFMQTADDFRNYIERSRRLHYEGTERNWVIKYKDDIAGRIGIHYIQQQNKTGAIGYWLGKEFEGKGIVTKSCKAVLDHCFTVLQLNRVELKCGTANLKSAAIADRMHFTQEGVLRQAERVNGKFIDLSLYAILKDEWFTLSAMGKDHL